MGIDAGCCCTSWGRPSRIRSHVPLYRARCWSSRYTAAQLPPTPLAAAAYLSFPAGSRKSLAHAHRTSSARLVEILKGLPKLFADYALGRSFIGGFDRNGNHVVADRRASGGRVRQHLAAAAVPKHCVCAWLTQRAVQRECRPHARLGVLARRLPFYRFALRSSPGRHA